MLEPLIRGGAAVRLEPIKSDRPQTKLSQWWQDTINERVKAPPGMISINNGTPDQNRKNPTGGPTILFTQWETNQPPKQWIPYMRENYDEIWVPTHSLGVQLGPFVEKPIKVLPYALQKDAFKKTKAFPDIQGIPEGAFVFGCTGMWTNRKNFGDLIISYIGEFSNIDRAVLVIKTNGQDAYNPGERVKLTKLIKQLRNGFNKKDKPRIVLLQDVFTDEAVDRIIRRFDCYVTTSRGESKDITMLKCMAQGKPCVFPANHAHRDIMMKLHSDRTEEDGPIPLLYPSGYTEEPVMQMGNYYTAADKWARIDVGAISQGMRAAYNSFYIKDQHEDSQNLVEMTKKYFTEDCLAGLVEECQPFAVQRLA